MSLPQIDAIGKRIERQRKSLRLSQATLGEMAGVHRNVVWRYESGQIGSLTVFLKLCWALGLKPWELLRDTDALRMKQLENL